MIANFSKLLVPINQMTNQDQKIILLEKAYEELKAIFTMFPLGAD